ncbi:aminomethyl transferase family protein [Pseudarthrobacter sp. LT1]|uniref:aminomethyl transferase family protein n=1 Tax=Pseudarthrobacter sp. LT1 TaxID=3111450 RepID=UPI002D76597F|nr:aminomethyl transferase family protein [Pseudarthrobacter sp. LT1]WRT13829.1 aminomethyl transferase family protein [Pseudarthrobacter sp. LT1]
MTETLQEALDRAASPVQLLRDSPASPHVFPVRAEFSNWRSEQISWRSTCALLDQSHHMTDLFLSGPGAEGLLRGLAVNSFANFPVDRAKQFIAVTHSGQLIGDAILAHLDEQSYNLVGHPMAIDWVQYHAESGEHDVDVSRDGNSIVRAGDPRLFRFELQGPTALAIVEKLTGAPVPQLGFFHMGRFPIAGLQVRGIRHGMAGQPGYELFGPWAEGARVRDALLQAGGEFGLTQVGAKGYSTANLESGWVPSPVPAVFTDEWLRGYREWLPASAAGSLGGSFDSADIEDYFVTPYELGYGRSVAFDHDFVGRDALEALSRTSSRRKVTLVWNPDDVQDVMGSILRPGIPAKYIDLPKARYALFQVDRVLQDGRTVGQSFDCGYIANEHSFVSLAAVDNLEDGAEVTVLWGEEPNSAKLQVEPHRQVPIRATVAPAPFVQYARESYRATH